MPPRSYAPGPPSGLSIHSQTFSPSRNVPCLADTPGACGRPSGAHTTTSTLRLFCRYFRMLVSRSAPADGGPPIHQHCLPELHEALGFYPAVFFAALPPSNGPPGGRQSVKHLSSRRRPTATRSEDFDRGLLGLPKPPTPGTSPDDTLWPPAPSCVPPIPSPSQGVAGPYRGL
ncbi:hypothetical protein GWK47_047522 [Chionoecetes opilio]|uniref:Uncharacterized protein n=1 Tax=Chionoecetes opilio TaxID=41210 RepID=A0A8J4Y4L4_CHIOP|nr:hypothetical protein GWK47_047522 [Chionoecetes opilio]